MDNTANNPLPQWLRELRAKNLRELQRRRKIERIFNIGGLRALVELIEEIIRHRLIDEHEIDRRLDRYVQVDPAALDLKGGNKLVAAPLHLVAASKRR